MATHAELLWKVKQGAYSKAVKLLIAEGKVRREDRPAAKLQVNEKIWLQ